MVSGTVTRKREREREREKERERERKRKREKKRKRNKKKSYFFTAELQKDCTGITPDETKENSNFSRDELGKRPYANI